MWGENPGWLWHQPGFPVHRIGSKGANQKSYPHAYTLGVFKTLNLIQIKSVRADKQKLPVDGQPDSTQ